MKLVPFLIVIFSLVGCGGGSSNSEGDNNTPSSSSTATISGTITGNGYITNNYMQRILNGFIPKAYAANTIKPNSVLVMYNRGNDQRQFPISDNGKFEIDTSLLDKDDLVIFVINSISKKVFGNINLATLTDAKLDLIDSSKLESDLNVGNISYEVGCCGSGESVRSTASFSISAIDMLEDIAVSDNSLILWQNKFRSPNYNVGIHALYNMDSVGSIKGNYSDISNFNTSNLIGLRPTVETELSEFNSIDENGISIYPPSNVNFTTARDGYFNQVANTTTALPSNYSSNRDSGRHSNWYEFGFCESFPDGDWLLKINGNDEVKGTFNLSGAYPYDINGMSIIPVPQIKLNMDVNDNTRLTSIDVKWLVYNGAQYEQISDDYMNVIAIQDNDGDGFIAPIRYWDGSTMQDVGNFKSQTWNGNYTLPSNTSVILPSNGRINMAYEIGQVSYQFMFE